MSEQKKIIIKSVSTEDIIGIQKVYYNTWLAVYPNKKIGLTIEDIKDFYKNSLTPETLEKRANYIKNMPANEKQFVAKEGDKVVGVCRLIKREDVNQLQAIYVLPEYQNKGIGTMLWGEALKWFTESKPIIVQVATYNDQAIAFYSKLGFKDNGKRFTEERMRMKSGAIIPEMEMVNDTRMKVK